VTAEFPPSIYVDVLVSVGGGATITFRELPPGTVAPSSPWGGSSAPVLDAMTIPAGGGWVRAFGAAVGPDPAITRYQYAGGELVQAAPHAAAVARVIGMIGRVAPETFVVLADMIHRRERGRRCAGGSDHR
jgi:hypothetical protein